jgi:hypothetical protein
LGGLLGLVDYLYLALLVLGDYRGVIGSHEVLAVELFERPRSALASSTSSYSPAYINIGLSLT